MPGRAFLGRASSRPFGLVHLAIYIAILHTTSNRRVPLSGYPHRGRYRSLQEADSGRTSCTGVLYRSRYVPEPAKSSAIAGVRSTHAGPTLYARGALQLPRLAAAAPPMEYKAAR